MPYDSTSDFSSAPSDVGYKEVQYNGSTAYIAYTNSQSSDSYANYGTGVRLNIDGTVCYVLTQIPATEITYDTPTLSLSYPTITDNLGGTTSPVARYSQVRHNADGSETTLSGELLLDSNVSAISYSFSKSTINGDLDVSIDSSSGQITSDGYIMSTDDTTSDLSIGTARVSATINGKSGSASATIRQTSIAGHYFELWCYDTGQQSAYSWNATIYENVKITHAYHNISSGGRYDYTGASFDYIRSYNSYEDAVSDNGTIQVLLPYSTYEITWNAEGTWDSDKQAYIHTGQGGATPDAGKRIEIDTPN